MISTRHVVTRLDQIPTSWAFQYYAGLNEQLHGQKVTTYSAFNEERTPSMKIYPGNNGNYYFHDYSSGKNGNIVTFLVEKEGITETQAINKIREDYEKYLKNGGTIIKDNIAPQPGWEVTDCKTRKWNQDDAKFWLQFGISSYILDYFGVKPLAEYTMSKGENSFSRSHARIYGYFDKKDILYKVYQPGNDLKCISVRRVVQGLDRLVGHNYLVIGSSLKDIMTVVGLNLNVDVIAPESENVWLARELIERFKKKYQRIAVLFDNDEAGIKAMKKYKEDFNLYPAWLRMSKDVSDSVRDSGKNKVLERIVPLLNNNEIYYL